MTTTLFSSCLALPCTLRKKWAFNGYSLVREGHDSEDKVLIERASIPCLARPLGDHKVVSLRVFLSSGHFISLPADFNDTMNVFVSIFFLGAKRPNNAYFSRVTNFSWCGVQQLFLFTLLLQHLNSLTLLDHPCASIDFLPQKE